MVALTFGDTNLSYMVYTSQSQTRAWAIFSLSALLVLAPVVGDTTSQHAYNLHDHPELSHLHLRLQAIIDKNKKEFTEISHYVPYVNEDAGGSAVLWAIIAFTHFSTTNLCRSRTV